MKNLRNMLIAVFAIVSFSTAAISDIGVGVTGSWASVTAQGIEKDANGDADTSYREATAGAQAMVGSVFAEWIASNGFVLGFDWIPGSADINEKSLKRTDTSGAGTETVEDDGERTAQATLKNHMTYYAEVPFGGSGLYGKLGYVTVDVNSTEKALVSTSGYNNDSTDGTQFGLGYKNGFGNNGYYKLEGSITDYSGVTFKGRDTDKGNTITADLDVSKITLALGYKF